MNAIISAQRSRSDLNESLGVIGRPGLCTLTVLTQLVVYQVIGSVSTYGLEAVGTEFQSYGTVHVTL